MFLDGTEVAIIQCMHKNKIRGRVAIHILAGLALAISLSGCAEDEERCEGAVSFCEGNDVYWCISGTLGYVSELHEACGERQCVDLDFEDGSNPRAECIDSVPVSSCSEDGFSCVGDQLRVCIKGQSFLSEDCAELDTQCSQDNTGFARCAGNMDERDASTADAHVPDGDIQDASGDAGVE